MKIRSLTPSFHNPSKKIRISQGEINEVQRAYLMSDHDFYQAAFMPFEYMRLTSKEKYRLTSFAATSNTWNAYKSCIGYKSNGSFETNTREFTPCTSYDFKQWCQDELIGSCMEHFETVSPTNGDLVLTPEGEEVWNEFTTELIYSSSVGLSNTLTVGNLYQGIQIDEINKNLSAEEKKEALASLNTESCRGWVTLLDDLATDGKGWLNCADELFGDHDFDNVCKYSGDILEMIEALICKAKPKLRKIITGGNKGRVGTRRIQAQIWVSDSFHMAIDQAYEAESKNQMQNERCIKKVSVTAAGETKDVFYIRNMPVIPICEINAMDDKLNGDTHFIGIFGSGVIQLGSSFGRISSDTNARDTAVMIQRNDNLVATGRIEDGQACYEHGMVSMLSHALTDTRIVDPECAVAAFDFYSN